MKGYTHLYSQSPATPSWPNLIAVLSFFFLIEGTRKTLSKNDNKPLMFYSVLLATMVGIALLNNSLAQGFRFFGLYGALLILGNAWIERKQLHHHAYPLFFLFLLVASTIILVPDTSSPFFLSVTYENFTRTTGISAPFLWLILLLFCLSSYWFSFLVDFKDEFENELNPHPLTVHSALWIFLSVFLMIIITGWLLTEKLAHIATCETQKDICSIEKHLKTTSMTLYLCEQTAKCMAQSPWIAPALISNTPQNISRAEAVLDRYCDMASAYNCSLANLFGKSIASTQNAHLSEASKPGIQAVLEGKTGCSFFFDCQSHIYTVSQPVYDDDSQIIGATVVQILPEDFIEELEQQPLVFLIDEKGHVLFPDSETLRLLTYETPTSLLNISNNGQYSINLETIRQLERSDLSNNHLASRFYLNAHSWSVVLLTPMQTALYARLLGIFLTFMLAIFFLHVVQRIFSSIKDLNRIASSEKRFKNLFEYAPEAILIVRTSDLSILEANPLAEKMLACSKKDILSKRFYDLLAEGYESPLPIFNPREENWTSHCKLIRNNTDELDAKIFSTNLKYNRQDAYLAFIHDYKQQEKLERRMAQLDRLDMVGQVAAGFAHEIRNPLTAISGFLQLTKYVSTPEKLEEHCAIMLEELDRANGIITEFLSLAKDQPPILKPQSLDKIIQTIAPILQAHATSSDKNLILSLEDTHSIMIDESEVRQLILNLVRNALEAIPIEKSVEISTNEIGNKVLLIVRDEGPGIPAEMLAQLGTPFLTTKEAGTGLGLAICYRIAKRHNAVIDVQSKENGTTFSIIFPLHIDPEKR
ncbi:MAG: ATP-binding protein [Bacillota bacterium]|nr:ATP-binding protein [Bacillota bacterium]